MQVHFDQCIANFDKKSTQNNQLQLAKFKVEMEQLLKIDLN
jgi:hypothetical protein